MITFHLTSVGKSALSEASLGTMISISNVIITDDESRFTIALPSELSGEVVFSQELAGIVVNNNIHLEFFDDSEDRYTAKTLALTFVKSNIEYVFALASSSNGLFEKTPSLLQAVIDVQFSDSQNITFDNTNITFPQASTSTNGSVRLATSTEIENRTGNGVVTAGDLAFLNTFVKTKLTEIAENDQIGSVGTFVYTEIGETKSIGDSISGLYLKPFAMTLDQSNNLSFSIDNNTSLSGTWKLLSYALQRSNGMKSIVLAVKTEN